MAKENRNLSKKNDSKLHTNIVIDDFFFPLQHPPVISVLGKYFLSVKSIETHLRNKIEKHQEIK